MADFARVFLLLRSSLKHLLKKISTLTEESLVFLFRDVTYGIDNQMTLATTTYLYVLAG